MATPWTTPVSINSTSEEVVGRFSAIGNNCVWYVSINSTSEEVVGKGQPGGQARSTGLLFPLIRLPKKLLGGERSVAFAALISFPLIRLPKKLLGTGQPDH